MSKSQWDAKTINLMKAKALFFCTAMANVGWSRFQNNFYLEQGLSPQEIGSLKGIGLLLKFLGEPVLCIIADLTDSRVIFSLCMIMQIVTMEMMRLYKPLTYSYLLLVKVLRTLTAPTTTLTNTSSFKLTNGTNQGYGKQRMFGSIAWGVGAFTCASLIDFYGMDAMFFYTYFFNFISFLVGYFGVPNNNTSTKSDSVDNMTTNSHAPRGSICAQACEYMLEMKRFLFDSSSCLLLLTNALVYGVVVTVFDTFLFISIQKDYHASVTFSGIVTSVSILACLPIFYYSDKLINKYGHIPMIVFAQVASIVRLLLYVLIHPGSNPVIDGSMSMTAPIADSRRNLLTLVLGVSLLHGFSFALFWSAIVDAIFKLGRCSLSATSMAALNVAFFTIGGAVGNFVWGWIYHVGGVINVYYCAAVIALVNVVVIHRFGKLSLGPQKHEYSSVSSA
jgi:PPP family 3-phenylpropionic acid transporter